MTYSGYIPCIALLLFSCANPACFGQTVTIRLVNLANESPVRNRHIYVSGVSGKTATEKDEPRKLITNPLSADLSLVTDAKGEAAFDLPKPAPAYFYVRAALSGPHWDCSCVVRVATEEMLQKGFVVRSAYAERKLNRSIQPKTGEVLFALWPVAWWVRLAWPLVKG